MPSETPDEWLSRNRTMISTEKWRHFSDMEMRTLRFALEDGLADIARESEKLLLEVRTEILRRETNG